MAKRSILRALQERQRVRRDWRTLGCLGPRPEPLPTPHPATRSLVEDLVPRALALVQVTDDVLYQAQQGLARLQHALAGTEAS